MLHGSVDFGEVADGAPLAASLKLPGHTLTQTHDLAYLVFETIRISRYGAHDDEAGGVRSQIDDSDAL